MTRRIFNQVGFLFKFLLVEDERLGYNVLLTINRRDVVNLNDQTVNREGILSFVMHRIRHSRDNEKNI